jgi:hypothetical protein
MRYRMAAKYPPYAFNQKISLINIFLPMGTKYLLPENIKKKIGIYHPN